MRGVWLFSLLAAVHCTSVCVQNVCAPKNLVADFVFMVDVSNALDSDGFYAVKNMLSNFTSQLKYGPTASQVAIYTYATRARSAGLLKNLNTADAVQRAVANINYDATEDRQLAQAFNLEEQEVTPANGFRPDAKHVLVVLAADEFTGQSPFTVTLDKIRAKFDMILTVGVGEQPIVNNFENMKKLAGDQADIFYALNYDQLQYVSLWLANNACPNSHIPPTTPQPTTMPTPAPSVPCSVASLNYDVYLVVDTSTTISASDFATLKKGVSDFVSVFPVGDSNINFGLVTVSLDAEVFYTGFHNNQNRASLLTVLANLNQDGSNGQALQLALKAVDSVYLAPSYKTSNKLVVYFSGNTQFDVDPTAQAASLASKYGAKLLAVKWTSAADSSKLATLAGGAACVVDASSNRAAGAAFLQTKMCQKSFCR